MPIPTHNPSCVTKAFETKCPDCFDYVWFFSCTCGSKLFFDQLGWPWAHHICRARYLREAVDTLKMVEHLTTNEIYQKIDDFAKAKGIELSDDVIEMLDREIGKRKFPFKVNDISNLDGVSDLSGKVINIDKNVNLHKRYNIDKSNIMAIGLGGDLITKSFAEITIRELPNKQNLSNQYKILVEVSYLKKHNLSLNSTILAEIAKVKSKVAERWQIVNHKCY